MHMATNARPILVAGQWRGAEATSTFQAENPATSEKLPDFYPVSGWADVDQALDAAAAAFEQLAAVDGSQLASFLETFAQRIEERAGDLVAMANAETALAVKPRLADVELPRTTGQLRQAALAARDGSWSMPTIDTKQGIRSRLEPIGPVCVFGPNNFPFAFGSISGGDFASAIAAGNPVIAKANSSHPGTTRIFAEEALTALQHTDLPKSLVQMLYRTSHADGERLASDPRLGAIAYTGSRQAGLQLKAAADAAGKPIYLELSSVNPVVILPGALAERADKIADEFTTSCLMGTGQFCTNPGLVILLASDRSEQFLAAIRDRFSQAPAGTLLSSSVARSLATSVHKIRDAGASVITGGEPLPGQGYRHANTLLRASAEQFLTNAHAMQTEAFGNSTLVVVAKDALQAGSVIDQLEGNLTGCIYAARDAADENLYAQLAPRLRRRVGRLLNDKMPTGVAVSPAMNHGGPFPATGHPGFTAVGIPAALRRFAMLACYDNVPEHRLPKALANKNPNPPLWRCIDGAWSLGDVAC